ncbi:unnamed protein product [Victoria cruziana]
MAGGKKAGGADNASGLRNGSLLLCRVGIRQAEGIRSASGSLHP